jgi:hypothetical protein
MDILLPISRSPLVAGHFTIDISPNPIPQPSPTTVPNLWRHSTIPPELAKSPQFYQHLLNTPPTHLECQEIAQELPERHLVACSNGAYDPATHLASHSWVFASNLLEDSHPQLLSSYRAKLSGILAVLYLIHRICQYYNIQSNELKVFSDNKGAYSVQLSWRLLGIPTQIMI